jgi:hypothetical protein
MSFFSRKASAPLVKVTSDTIFVAFFDRSGGYQGSTTYSNKSEARVARQQHADLEARMGDVRIAKFNSNVEMQSYIRRS